MTEEFDVAINEVGLELGDPVGAHLAVDKSLSSAGLVNKRLCLLVWAEHGRQMGISWEFLPKLSKLDNHPQIAVPFSANFRIRWA